ncbi:MAG: Na(+)/H(+) antiporter NhaA, partial [Sphingobacteriales bacterium]
MGANKILRKKLRDQLLSPVREFISDSRAVGIVLIVCTAIALTVTNTSWGPGYSGFWETAIHYPFTTIHLPHTILHLINDGLMAIFFFLVGLEIKRELMAGELASIRKSLLPVIAALGGMVVPAGLYLLWCGNTPFSNG